MKNENEMKCVMAEVQTVVKTTKLTNLLMSCVSYDIKCDDLKKDTNEICQGARLSLGRDLKKLHTRVVNSDIYFEVILK